MGTRPGEQARAGRRYHTRSPRSLGAGTRWKVWVTWKGKAHDRLRLFDLTHKTLYPARHVGIRLTDSFSKFSPTEKKFIFFEIHGACHKVFHGLPTQVPVALSHFNTANEAEMIVWNENS